MENQMEKNMENDMETLGTFDGNTGICRAITPIMENQMEKKMAETLGTFKGEYGDM